MANKNDKPEDARLGGKRPKSILPKVAESKQASAGSKAFNLFIFAFIIYGLYSYMQKGGDVGIFNEIGEHLNVIDTPQNGDPRIDRLLEQKRISALDNFSPVERLGVKKLTVREGKGLPVSCGQTVTYRLISGVGSEQQITDEKKFRLGDYQKP